jgi:hypothetical protein
VFARYLSSTRSLIVAAFAVLLGLVMVAPASAHVESRMSGPTPHCGSNIVCWYSQTNFTGRIWSANPQAPGTCLDMTGRGGPQAESVANASGFPQRFWSNHNCTGLNILVQPGQEVGSIGFQAYSLGGL